jgi:iron complex outermembrane receptor protein
VALDNICLGYNFTLSGNSSFNKVRVYLAGNNLFYITNYKGPDPNPRYTDVSVYSYPQGSPLVPGIDRGTTWPEQDQYLSERTLYSDCGLRIADFGLKRQK